MTEKSQEWVVERSIEGWRWEKVAGPFATHEEAERWIQHPPLEQAGGTFRIMPATSEEE